MRGTRSVPLIFCFSPFEFEQRLLILNRQQPAGRLTATFASRRLRDGGKLAQLAEHREDNWVNSALARVGSRWFKLGRGSHPHRSKKKPMRKSLVLQGFFGLFGQFF